MPAAEPADTGMTLETAVEKGLQRAVDYQNQILDEKTRVLEKKSAKMKKYLSIDSAASYLYKSEQMEISFPGMSVTAGAKHNYDLNIALKQPIYTGNILTESVKGEELQLAVAQNRTLVEAIETAAEIKSSYFNYHLLLNKKKSLDTLIRQLNIHLKKIEDFYREELVRKTDLLETRRKIREQEINAEELAHLIASEKIRFEKLCGVDIETVAPGCKAKVGDLSESMGLFKKSHPVLETLAHRVQLFSSRGKMVKGQYLPQVAGFAELHYGRPGVDFFKNEWQLYFQGGVSLSLKLFDWNKKKRDLRVLDYETQKVINQRNDFIREAEKGLKQLYDMRRSIEKKMAILDDLVSLAEEDAQLKAGLYKEQQVSNVDYLDALTISERYASMKNELKMQRELIHVNINKLIGKSI
jgi:outer membrane protein TolC